MIIGINCGHTVSGTVGSGAVGILNESDETRAVGYRLMDRLRKTGNTVIDCTDDKSPTVNANLKKICDMANAQPLDMFLSIHFNSGGGKGCEAYTYDGKDKARASQMLDALKSLGFVNRGVKDGSRLYVIRHTNAPACLLEVCFVDTQSDADLYRRLGADLIADKLCEAITGKNPNDSEHENSNNEGDLTMTQYEELKKLIEDIDRKIDSLAEKVKEPMIYNYVDDNMPEWARPTIKRLEDNGILKGDGDGLGLTDEMLRILVICDRAGAFCNLSEQ